MTASTSRCALLVRQRRAAGCPAYAADFRLIRGKCLRPRCGSRLGVIRLTVDYTSRKVREQVATIECAACGRTWRRTRAPKLGEYQSVRLTLILPGDQKRWFARGKYHVEGSDAIIVREGTWSDLLEAEADWKRRNGQYAASVAKAAAKKEAKAAATHADTMAWLAHMNERHEQREAEEAEAAARDAERGDA